MKTILQVIVTGILLLSPTNFSLANQSVFKDLHFLKNDWYKLTFPPYNMSTGVQVFKTRDEYLNDKRKVIGLLNIPPELKHVIFDKNTLNPFRTQFPYIYTLENQRKIRYCNVFKGAQIELDDNSKTEEWYILSPIETCLLDKDHYLKHPVTLNTSEVGHIWIIQKSPNGQYRLLMESEGSTDITNKKYHGYKHLITQVYNNHIYRQKDDKKFNRYCGKAWISWRYEISSYQPTKVNSKGSNCKYHSKKHLYKLEKEVVTPLVLRWISTYTPKPITINEKNEVIPLHETEKKLIYFSQNELKAINKLIRE